MQPIPPEQQQAVAHAPSEVSEAQSEGVSQSAEVATKAQKKKKRNKAARRAAKMATEAEGAPPTAGPGGGAGGQMSLATGLPRRGKVRCPVFGCTRKHAPDNCPTFQDMTPKERLDLIHMKQLCLLCLGHSMEEGCETIGRGPGCTMDGCGKPHHEMLHGVLKAGESSLPAEGTDPSNEPLAKATATAAAGKAPDLVRQLRGLLEGLGIDPDALEVRIRVRRPGEQGRTHDGGGAAGPVAVENGEKKLTGKLLEALSLLCQAGEKFMSCMGESQQHMIKTQQRSREEVPARGEADR